MIKIICFYFSFLIIQTSFAQTTNLSIKKYLDNTPSSPNAAALTKYVNADVSLNTGMVGYSVPIYDLQYKKIRVPINLHYASNGIKVNDVPSLTGMGWTLEAGGVITRQRNGALDETAQRVSLADNTSTCSNVFHDVLFNYSSPYLIGSHDTEPDIFSFSFNGYSGKFVLDSNKKPFLIPKSNLKIDVDFTGVTYTSSYTFKITTPDGLKYYFGGSDATEETILNGADRVCTYGAAGNDIPVKTAFYLYRIETPGGDFITFDYNIYCYEQMPVNIIELCNHPIEEHDCDAGSPACPDSRETYYNQAYYRYRVLRQINIPNVGRIQFNYLTYNTLNGTNSYANYKTLSNISITNNQGRTIKNVSLAYSNVQTSIGAGDTYPGLIPSSSVRPFLNSVSDGFNFYSFQYDHPDSLPVFASFSQDLWGFNNGQDNAHFIPNIGINQVECPEAIANRNVYPQYAKYGLLKKITSPTGGWDSISYEGNVTANGAAGGLRVNKVVTYDNVSKTYSFKKYYYAPLANLDSVVGSSVIPVVQGEKLTGFVTTVNSGGTYYPCLSTCSYQFTGSQALNDLNIYGGNIVSYPVVTEGLGENFEDGAVEHEFRVQNYNYAYNVMNASIYDAPVNLDAVLYGTETKTKAYKKNPSGSFTLLKQNERFYSIDSSSIDDRVIGWKFYLKWEYIDHVICNYDEGEVSKTYYYRFWPHLDSTISTEYDENGLNPLLVKSYNYYGNAQHMEVTKNQTFDSKGSLVETTFKYPHDFVSAGNVYDTMVVRNIIPAVETKTTKGSESFRIKTNYSYDWYTDKHLIAVSNIEAQKDANSTESRVRYYNYDSSGMFLELGKEDDYHTAYLWDYNHSLVTAEVKNAVANDIAYTSFEGDNKGNWSYGGVAVPDSMAPTGKKVYNLTTAYPITKSGLSSSNTYIVTYWTTNSSAYTLSGTVAGYPILRKTIGNWKLYEHKITDQISVTFSGNGTIDELRLYPVNALMATYVYEPMLGMTAQCDANNHITYYEYDDYGHLLLVRDELKNILKKYCYSTFIQEEPNCNLVYNEVQTETFTKQCDSGYLGSQVTYTVPAGTYGASSLLNANALALGDITLNGQAYANAYGTCVVACTSNNCSGVDKKCINNNCETGVKVYTSSTLVHANIYSCTYHYEWSDGSWSQDYTETHTGPCPINIE